MPDSSQISEAQLSEHLKSLIGATVDRVSYCGLRYDDEVRWDFEDWHHTEMGIELHLADGRRFGVTWGDAFGRFHVELRPVGLGEVLPVENLRVWDVTGHPTWSALCPLRVEQGEWVWAQTTDSDHAPVALRLTFEHGTVWIVAGEPLNLGSDEILVGMDSLMVVFSVTLANQLGVRA